MTNEFEKSGQPVKSSGDRQCNYRIKESMASN